MVEVQRKFVFDHCKKQTVTCFEDLSNETFYDIFEYFNGHELIQIFFNINHQLEQLLRTLPVLIKTHFYLNDVKQVLYSNVELSSIKFSSSLNTLSVYYSNDLRFINADRWEGLIRNCYPVLQIFHLTYSHSKSICDYHQLYSKLNQFSSLFWSNRNWLCEIMIDDRWIYFSIHPHRKTSDETSLSTLTFMNSDQIHEEMILDDLKIIRQHIQIYHLNIMIKHVSYKLIFRLPFIYLKLKTLHIHSLQQDPFHWRLLDEDFFYSHSLLYRLHIKSISLEQLSCMQHIYDLRQNFPLLNSVEIKQIVQLSIEDFVREFIHSSAPYDHKALYIIHMSTTDDQSLENLDAIIQPNNSPIKYSIKRLKKRIFIQLVQ